MEPAERLFLNTIGDFTVEDIKYAIGVNMDLATVVQEELPDYLDTFRGAAKIYTKTHPNYQEYLRDPKRAAQKLVYLLKTYKPILGYEIELYKSYPTTSTTGFKIKASSEQAELNVGQTQGSEHVGYAWVAKNIVGLSKLLL